MSVQFTAIAHKQTVLCQKAKSQKLDQQFTLSLPNILSKFSTSNYKASLKEQNFTMYVYISCSVTFIAFADHELPKETVFNMLKDTQEKFNAKYQLQFVYEAAPQTFQRDFSPVLERSMNEIRNYSSKVAQIQKDLQDTKLLAVENVNDLIKRTEKINDIASSADDLREDASAFLQGTKGLKKTMNKKKWCVLFSIIGGVLLLAAIVVPIVLSVCGVI